MEWIFRCGAKKKSKVVFSLDSDPGKDAANGCDGQAPLRSAARARRPR